MANDTNSKKVWNPSALTPLEKVSIKHAFVNMAKGDAIDRPDFHLVVMRVVDGKGIVIAESCDSAEQMLQLFDTTFTWSEEKVALVDTDGDIPDWWGIDLQVTRDEHLKFAERYAHVPISAEYPKLLEKITEEMKERNNLPIDQIVKAAETLHYGGGLASLVFSVEVLGISLTPEEVTKIYLMYEAMNNMRGDRNITMLIGVPLSTPDWVGGMIKNSSSHTKH